MRDGATSCGSAGGWRLAAVGAVLILLITLLLVAAPAVADDDEMRLSPHTEFGLIEEQVPGFGGAWVEGDAAYGQAETLHLWLVEPSDEAERLARTLLVEQFGDRFDQDAVVVHHADLPWGQLHTWFITVSELTLGRPEVITVAIDERINRIAIGVQDPEHHESPVRQVLDDNGIPQQAVVFEQRGPVEQLIGLPDSERRAQAARTFLAGFLSGGLAVAGALVLTRRARARAAREDGSPGEVPNHSSDPASGRTPTSTGPSSR